jgi:hypothetical protein
VKVRRKRMRSKAKSSSLGRETVKRKIKLRRKQMWSGRKSQEQ